MSGTHPRLDARYGYDADCKRVDEGEPPKARTCECRYCKGEAVELGRLKGDQTDRIVQMAEILVSELGTHLPEVNQATVHDLLAAIRMSWLTGNWLRLPMGSRR